MLDFLLFFAGKKPSQALPRQIPPFVTYGDIFPPERGKSFLKGRAGKAVRL